MCGPKPVELGRLLDKTLHGFKIEGLAPFDSVGLEGETEARRMVDEALAELAVAQDQARPPHERELAGDDVVGQRAGPEENLHLDRAGQLTEQFFSELKLGQERLGAMRHWRL